MSVELSEKKTQDPKDALAVCLLQELCRDEKDNFVISPLSLGMAFAMLSAGLKDDTKAEVLKILGTLNDEELHSMYGQLLSEKNLPLKIANKYLYHHECKIQTEFEALLKVKY